MADKIDVNDRRGLKRQTADEKSDHVDAEERLYKLPRCENFEKDQGKQWESCTTEVNHQNLDAGEHANIDSSQNTACDLAKVVDKRDEVNGSSHTEAEIADSDDPNDDRVSEISGISDVSVSGTGRWHPVSRAMLFVRRQMSLGCDPRSVLRTLLPDEADSDIPDDLDDMTLWRLIISLVSAPPRRHRLAHMSTLDDVVRLLQTCTKIIVLTGAGVSVSCGIPDFRSANGIYARLAVDYPDLPNPQAMFDIAYFRRNPRPFFQFAKEIYPGQFTPSVSHRFIRHLEMQEKLLRNYTQNIDTLEQAAGITRVVQCHGSFAAATCMICKHHVESDAIRDDVLNQVIPKCPRCDPSNESAILKPDIVFFGESLPEEFHKDIQMDKDECDLLIVIGSSLKVQPVALIPSSLPAHVPQILINREPLRNIGFDVELLGDCDVIVNELCHRLGDSWKALCTTSEPAVEIQRDETVSLLLNDRPAAVEDDSAAAERQVLSDARDGSSGLQSASDNGSSLENRGDSSGSNHRNHCSNGSVQVDGHIGHRGRCWSLGAADGYRRVRQDSVGSGERRRHRSRHESIGCGEHDHHRPMNDSTGHEHHRVRRNSAGGRLNHSSVDQQRDNNDGGGSGGDVVNSSENTVDTVKERNQVLETIQRHDQDITRVSKPQPVNWASLLSGNKFLHLGPRQYVFTGAEVYGDVDESSSDDEDGDDNSLSSSFDDIDDSSVKNAEAQNSIQNDSGQVGVELPSPSATPVDLPDADSSDGSVDP